MPTRPCSSAARGATETFPHPAISELYSIERKLRSVRTLDSKLLDDQARESVFWFDLAADPHELTSVYADPRYDDLVIELKEELKALRAQYGDEG